MVKKIFSKKVTKKFGNVNYFLYLCIMKTIYIGGETIFEVDLDKKDYSGKDILEVLKKVQEKHQLLEAKVLDYCMRLPKVQQKPFKEYFGIVTVRADK